jgi:putative ABC transport system permease protein
MTALLRERPGRAAADDGGAPARQALIRWAWRLFRREWRQQLLVLALLIVAVTATTFAAAVATNTPQSPDATFGTADYLLTLPGSDQHLAADIAAIRTALGPIEVIEHQKIAIPGSAVTVDLRAQDPKGGYGRPMLRLDAGRYPAGPGQVAVTSQVASIFGLKIGDVWRAGGRDRRVTGLVENPQNLLDQFALVAPGQASPPVQVTVLLDATAANAALFSFPVGSEVAARTSVRGASEAEIVLVLATLGLLFIGLVAVAGFTVMAHRRLRALGMLGALGATDRHVRLVMLANGGVVGVVGTLIGAAIGLVGWIAVAPALETIAEHRIDKFSLPWLIIGAAMVLAVLTSIIAAWWPARSAARIPAMAALSGRPAPPQPGHRFAVPGGILLVVGLGVLSFADQNGGVPPLVVIGILATALGILFLAPVSIAALAAVGRRSPIAVRLALRDLARFQARSGAALAAISLAVGIAATIAIAVTQAAAQAAEAGPTGPNLPASQLVLYLSPTGLDGLIPSQTPAELQSLQARVNSLASSLHAQDSLALDAATSPAVGIIGPASGPGTGGGPHSGNGRSLLGGRLPAGLVKATSSCPGPGGQYAGQVYVATPALLQHYGIKTGDIRPSTDIITSRTDLASVQLATGATAGCGYDSNAHYVQHPAIQIVGLPTYSSDPDALLTAHALQALGLKPVLAGWLIQAPRALTATQISTARQVAAAVGGSVETRSTQDSLSRLRDAATAVGLLLALGVLAMTIGLIRSETAGDLRTLAAAGASSRTRRMLTAATAGALGLLGALLGTTGAYLALIAWHRSNLGTLSNVPLASILVIVIGLPLAATAGGWLLAGRQPPAIARRPSD